MSLEEIKSNWSKTDELIYGKDGFDVKLQSLNAAKTKVDIKKSKNSNEDKESPFAYPDDKN